MWKAGWRNTQGLQGEGCSSFSREETMHDLALSNQNPLRKHKASHRNTVIYTPQVVKLKHQKRKTNEFVLQMKHKEI